MTGQQVSVLTVLGAPLFSSRGLHHSLVYTSDKLTPGFSNIVLVNPCAPNLSKFTGGDVLFVSISYLSVCTLFVLDRWWLFSSTNKMHHHPALAHAF
jgi:hypothetical protein